MQKVKQPTRGDHLLDVVITDIDGSVCSTRVMPAIADHRVVVADLSFQLPKVPPCRRQVWHYGSADWAGLRKAIATADWGWIDHTEPCTATARLTAILSQHMEAFIPNSVREVSKA